MLIEITQDCAGLDDLLAEPSSMRVKNFLLDLRNGLCPPSKKSEAVEENMKEGAYV